MGSQNFRAVAARATIVIRGRGLNNTPQTNPLRGVTYPGAYTKEVRLVRVMRIAIMDLFFYAWDMDCSHDWIKSFGMCMCTIRSNDIRAV